MKTISTLPTSYKEVEAMDEKELVETVLALADIDTEISFQARMNSSAFFCYAAVILAKVVKQERETEVL